MGEPSRDNRVPRVAVFVPQFGAPSEVWTVRQCLGFRLVEPVVICWQRHSAAPVGNYGLSVIQLGSPWHRRRSFVRRVGSRLGWPWAELPGASERREIQEVLQHSRAMVALCHFAWTGLRVASAIGSRLPTVWHVHGRDLSTSLQNTAYHAAIKRLIPSAAGVVAVGAFQLETLRWLGLPAGRGVLIPCGAPFGQFAARPISERGKEAIRYVTVGRLSPEKGILETIRAFAELHRRYPESELVVVGGGELRDSAETLTRRLSIAECVRFAGELPPEDVARELASAHVFVQHSRPHRGSIEGFGVTLTEAGASGLPLVASRFGGIIDQVKDGHNGLLFEPGDVEAQARAMLQLAQDEPRRRLMAARARKIAELFDSVVQISRLESFLLRLALTSDGPS